MTGSVEVLRIDRGHRGQRFNNQPVTFAPQIIEQLALTGLEQTQLDLTNPRALSKRDFIGVPVTDIHHASQLSSRTLRDARLITPCDICQAQARVPATGVVAAVVVFIEIQYPPT